MTRIGTSLVVALVLIVLAMLVPEIGPVVGFATRVGGLAFMVYAAIELMKGRST